jgi:hypothetical protein
VAGAPVRSIDTLAGITPAGAASAGAGDGAALGCATALRPARTSTIAKIAADRFTVALVAKTGSTIP